MPFSMPTSLDRCENPQDVSCSNRNHTITHNDSDSDSKDEIRQAQNTSTEGSGITNPNQADAEASKTSTCSFWEQPFWATTLHLQRWQDLVQDACTTSPCQLWESPLEHEREPPIVTVYSSMNESPRPSSDYNAVSNKNHRTTASSITSLTVDAKVSSYDSVHQVHATDATIQDDAKVAHKKKQHVPVETIDISLEQSLALERSMSELTMRSCNAATNRPEQPQQQSSQPQRRMAYYAVGKYHQQSGRGSNRRCYFTGKLIMDGTPYYAGSVEQGLRTLVVFCLPSALRLPDPDTVRQCFRATNSRRSVHSRAWWLNSSLRKSADSVASKSLAGSRTSRMSSLDDLSMSIDGDLDPNWSLDRDVLLQVLPPASPQLLQQMADVYGEQFETLPVQVRDANVWKLYVKFCFFSGLPIAGGELHYKVVDPIAEAVYGEEIPLSHEVMEASTSSAEILALPNRVVLQYLRQNYAQQCSKLDDRVFQRENWERVAPEV